MKFSKKLIISSIINAFLILTVAFFASMDVYMSNYNDFVFPFEQTWWIVFLFSSFLILVISLIESILPENFFIFLMTLSFGIALCSYFQILFFNGKLVSSSEGKIFFSNKVVIFNLMIWIVIVSTTIVISCFDKQKVTKYYTLVSGAILLIELVGFISCIPNLSENDFNKEGYFSSDGEYELSRDNNVVYFIVDACSGEIVESTLNKYPDLFDGFEGFTYYPDMISKYSRTYPSIIYLLTNQQCWFDKPFVQFAEEAQENGILLPELNKAGVDIRLYTEPLFLGRPSIGIVDNYSTYSGKSLEIIRPWVLIKQMMHISLYKCMPYLIKNYFEYNVPIMNYLVKAYPSDVAIQFDDVLFYENLKNKGLKVNDEYSSAFRFYHLSGVHDGTEMTKDFVYDESAEKEDTLFADFEILRHYIEQMKILGIFDQSTIIITADHGNSFESEQLMISEPATCLLMYKPAKTPASEEVVVSDTAMSHDNIIATVLDSFSLDYSSVGKTISEVQESDNSLRTYYYSALREDKKGEVGLREYKVEGDSRLFSNWSLTGNFWNIDYSYNRVSGEILQ
ncbi:MAG: hypothetical protein Q4F31_07235 [Eubacteriales bacterium]|nr:hypothetical protein [Eubacteriales bacterium]